MKRSTLVTFLVILLGCFSTLSVHSVKAESINTGKFVEVSVSSAKLYNSTGRALGKTEPKDSEWFLGKTININGKNFYQVATDEYLSSSDSFTYQNRPEVIKVSSNGDVPVYNHDFVESTNVALAPGTSWYSDRVITTPEGMPFVRVATNEYVGMWYVVQQKFTQKY